MIYINLKNFELYKNLYDTRIKGPVVEIDEMIAPAVQLLNQKGYWVLDSNSGHIADYPSSLEHTYIRIKTDKQGAEQLKKNIPDGIEYKEITNSDEVLLIDFFAPSKIYPTDDPILALQQIQHNCIILYNWANSVNANDIIKKENDNE